MRVKIAQRNLFRNQRKSLLNLSMIAAGVAAILLFLGFSIHLLRNFREAVIRSETGHLQLGVKALWENTGESPKELQIQGYPELLRRVRGLPHVKSASGRLTFFGLAGSGERSSGFRGVAIDPEGEPETVRAYPLKRGAHISNPLARETMVGIGLAKRLKVAPGDELTLIGHTLDGVLNALEVAVVGLISTGMADLDNTTLIVPLTVAQQLIETESAQRIVVNLDSTERTDELSDTVKALISDSGSAPGDVSGPVSSNDLGKEEAVTAIELRRWEELAVFYKNLRAFYGVYNGIISAIILLLVFVSILNTVGMSIFERTGEIGTLRALGETRKDVVELFSLEGFLLGSYGAILGVVAAIVIALLINAIQIQIKLPNAGQPIPLVFAITWESALQASALAASVSLLAAWVPALRATRMRIVDALRRNI